MKESQGHPLQSIPFSFSVMQKLKKNHTLFRGNSNQKHNSNQLLELGIEIEQQACWKLIWFRF